MKKLYEAMDGWLMILEYLANVAWDFMDRLVRPVLRMRQRRWRRSGLTRLEVCMFVVIFLTTAFLLAKVASPTPKVVKQVVAEKVAEKKVEWKKETMHRAVSHRSARFSSFSRSSALPTSAPVVASSAEVSAEEMNRRLEANGLPFFSATEVCKISTTNGTTFRGFPTPPKQGVLK